MNSSHIFIGSTSFVISTSATVTVTAKDSSSNNIGHGGDLFYIQISNPWTRQGNFDWIATTGAVSVLSSSILTLMNDNSNGTYSYTYTASIPGSVTVSVILYSQGWVYNEYYTNNNFSGTNSKSNTTTDINFTTWSSDAYINPLSSFSSKYIF